MTVLSSIFDRELKKRKFQENGFNLFVPHESKISDGV